MLLRFMLNLFRFFENKNQFEKSFVLGREERRGKGEKEKEKEKKKMFELIVQKKNREKRGLLFQMRTIFLRLLNFVARKMFF